MRWFRNSRAPRAEGSHVRVAVFPVNNRPETVERFRPHVKVGSSHDAAVRRGALASDAFVALFTFQTAHVYSFPRRVFCARDFVPLLRSPRIEGWAKRRETFGCCAKHPLGVPSCVKDARERALGA